MSNGIILGIDLDEVVFSYIKGLRLAMKSAGLEVKEEEPEFYSLYASGWFKSEEEFKEFHGGIVDKGLYENLELIPGARKTLWDLSNRGYRLDIITSRFVNPGQHSKVVTQTINALESNKIPFNNLSFLGGKSIYKPDVFLDDSPKNIESIRASGTKAVIFDFRYNRYLDGLRVKTWEEFSDFLGEEYGF